MAPQGPSMNEDGAKRLAAIVTALDAHIALLRGYDFHETAALLAIAKLDLQIKIHGISDQELRALCEYIEAQEQRHGDRERAVIDFSGRVRK
jgi:predicted Zn-dependent protease